MCTFVLYILLMVALVVWGFRLAQSDPHGMGGHLPTIAGVALSLVSFMLLPWISFSPTRYLGRIGPGLLGEFLVEALPFLLKLFGKEAAATIPRLLQSIGGMPGWVVAFASFVPVGKWGVCDWTTGVTLLMVPVASGFSLLRLALTLLLSPGERSRRVGGILQFALGLGVALLLLLQMPKLDSLARPGNLFFRFLAIITGARMSFSVWLAWLGLLLLSMGGLSEILSASSAEPPCDEEPY